MALANNGKHLTLPHAIQEFRMNLGFLPTLWAESGDFVLVDDVLFAIKALSQLHKPHADVLFITTKDLKHLVFDNIEPWGWDKAVRQTLADAGISADSLPSDEHLAYIRHLSDRKHTAEALVQLRNGVESMTCGESMRCTSVEEVYDQLHRHGKIVIKAPWSSSGRGVRYAEKSMDKPMTGWINKTIAKQGGIMTEPYYKKVKDFALEFYSHGDGRTDYCGMSVFITNKSSYAGNLIATEEEKMAEICRLLPKELINDTILRLSSYLGKSEFGRYRGPLGVDMMAVAKADGRGFLLHPCVEINVRRTMGHVANAFRPEPTEPQRLMHIVHDVNYKLKFDNIDNHFVKVI